MKLLFEEYSELIITIVGGLIIISIIINSCLNISINAYHNELLNNLNPIIEKIGSLNCKDVLLKSLDDDLLAGVSAYSNTGKDIKEYVTTRFVEVDGKRYVEYLLKYNNDFMIKRVKCYIEEDNDSEDDV